MLLEADSGDLVVESERLLEGSRIVRAPVVEDVGAQGRRRPKRLHFRRPDSALAQLATVAPLKVLQGAG